MACAFPLFLLVACGLPAGPWARPPRSLDRAAPGAPPEPPARTVVLVSLDGFAPRVLDATETPFLDSLARDGTVAVRAETVVPSRTLPAHTSMLSGVAPEQHGVRWNRWERARTIEVDTVFGACRRNGLRCGLFAAKDKLAHFVLPEPGVERWARAEDASDVLAAARTYLAERSPHFVMIHLAELDRAGHRHGWGSEAQREALRRLDAALAGFVAGAGPAPLALIVTSDHGGHGRRHGGGGEEDVRIPWIAWGDGVPAGRRLERVRTEDTAATVLALLGVPAPPEWLGRARLPLYPRAEVTGGGS